MCDLLRSPRVSSLFPYTTLFRSGNSMFFLLITCYMPWTFRREHCPPWRNNTTGTPGAHREACGHGRGAVKTWHLRKITWIILDAIIPALKHRIPSELRRDPKSTRLNSSHECISYAVFGLN